MLISCATSAVQSDTHHMLLAWQAMICGICLQAHGYDHLTAPVVPCR
jgi:hypothetical protein